MNFISSKLKKVTNHQNIVIFSALIPIMLFGVLTYYKLSSQKTQEAIQHIEQINKQNKSVTLKYFKKVEFDTYTLKKNISYLQKQAKNNIINLQEIQYKHIIDYYESLQKQLIALSKQGIAQYIYTLSNKNKTIVPTYSNSLHKYVDEIGIQNLLMIDPQGKIIYSSNQPTLLNKNVRKISKTFEHTFNKLKKSSKNSASSLRFVQLSLDNFSQKYKEYAIMHFQDVGGFIAIEVNLNHVQEDISNVSSLGETAETYLTYKNNGKTYLALDRHVKPALKGALKEGRYIDLGFHSTGVDLKEGSTGKIELVGYRPITIKNLSFSMQTTVSYMDVISPVIDGVNNFEQFLKDYKYENMMLISKDGKIFYSAKKEKIFQTNIFTGKYSQTFLAKSIQKVFKTKKFLLTDIGINKVCENSFDQFAIMPILSKNKDIEKIIVIELNLNALSNLLQGTTNVSKGVETFLLADDKKLRSNTMQNNKYNIHNCYKKNLTLTNSLYENPREKDLSTIFASNYQNKEVLATFININYSDIHWSLITELDNSVIIQSLIPIKQNIYLFLAISSLLSLLSMFIITNEKKKNDKKIKHQALHDNLTQLPNRKYAQEFLVQTLKDYQRNHIKGAVLFMDLDKFKSINDTHGHKAGDFVLIEVAKRLKSTLRSNDLVARLGGDEFLMVINNYDIIYNLDTICNKLLASISQPIFYENQKLEVGLSIGIATFPNDSTDATDLLTFSDAAMYKTKENGRNSYTFYDAEMTKLAQKNVRISRELKDAIQNNELLLHYQPQIDLKTQKVLGTEALVRWQHPKDGFMSPIEFIPIAEESNLIIELGYWVLEKACKDFLEWQAKGYTMNYVAVNMSSKQLQSPECVNSVLAILKKLSFPPQQLELEITETTLIANFDTTIENINAFKELGVKFSIDDFGTGYSSLSYLKSLQISTLKIDREFVKDMIEDKDDRTIVNAVIAMGHALNYTIVAEGAETKAEVELLKYLGCDIVQGYYFSKPLSSKDLLTFIDVNEENNPC